MIFSAEDEDLLIHYGVLRKSGRYPWGSGETQTQRNRTFLETIEKMKRDGMSEVDIAKSFSTEDHPFTTKQLRALKSIAVNEEKAANIAMAQRLRDKGMSNQAIADRMGLPNESSVRSLLVQGAQDRTNQLQTVADMLESNLNAKDGYIDIGTGVALQLGMTESRLSTAVAILEEKGYTVTNVQVPQISGDGKTTVKVLAKPGVEYKDIVQNKEGIRQINEFSDDGGRTIQKPGPAVRINPDRIAVRYAEQGGADADGVIYIRPGVDDISLGGARYAQVRIGVDPDRYLKGMAMYKDDLPKGVDLMFNTNKSDTGNKLDAMKEMKRDKETGKVDEDNPFGAVTRPKLGANGKPNAMNIVNEEGDWQDWSRNLASQMLSKQNPQLAEQQLGVTFERKKKELAEIMALTNPVVKEKLLGSFADGADSSAVHLKAAALPRQASHVILPMNKLRENEIYAPNFRDGERVALVRYPHGGIFEIPELTVNNRNPDAKKALGNALDAVGIHSKVASKLSGADFDGDTVLVIPNNSGAVKSKAPLQKLKDFDPQRAYPAYDGMKTMGGGTWDAKAKKEVFPEGKGPSSRVKQQQMGKISNLITDMTIRGASDDELARAVRHSMVVIDGEKHRLNYKQSAIDNGIPALYAKYQNNKQGGASTLISQATARKDVERRKLRRAGEGGPIDPTTGKQVFVKTGESYVNAKGKTIVKTEIVDRLADTDDAFTLSSGTKMETVYAEHSNRLKALANEARRESLGIQKIPYSPSAKKAYALEVDSLNAKLNLAIANRPRERQAQLVANTIVAQKRAANPDMDRDDLKKVQFQALAEARIRTGADKYTIDIEPREWDAIQAGAISNARLGDILNKADLDQVKALATPRERLLMNSANISRAKAMANSGYSQAEIADALGVSVTTLKNAIVV